MMGRGWRSVIGHRIDVIVGLPVAIKQRNLKLRIYAWM